MREVTSKTWKYTVFSVCAQRSFSVCAVCSLEQVSSFKCLGRNISCKWHSYRRKFQAIMCEV